LPEEYKKIRDLIRNYLKKNKIGSMKNMNRLELLKIQDWAIKNDNYELVVKVSSLLLAIHALYLLETQGVEQLKRFLNELKNKETKSADHLLKSIEFIKIREFIKDIKMDHPKIEKLIEILKDGKKTIIFTNYRDSSSYITEVLNRNDIKSLRFVGQGKKGEEKGLSQKEQKEIIEKFKNENYQCLVCTSVGEEGIDIPKVDRVIFYEPVPSEIRTIQRRGRVGRTQSGEVIFLATKGTYDEANLYISKKKEYIMRKIIKEISEIESL
jgi:Fanconi anemia group M protein